MTKNNFKKKKSLKIQKEYVNEINTLYQQGLVCFNKKDFSNSIMFFEKVLRIEPIHKESLNSLGVINKILNNYDLSILYFKKALSLDPKYIDALINLTNTYDHTGDKVNALRTQLRVLEVEPQNVKFLEKLAFLLKNTQLTKFNHFLDRYMVLIFEKKIKVDIPNLSSLLISLVRLNPIFLEYFHNLKKEDINLEVNDLIEQLKKLKLLVNIMPLLSIRDFDIEFCLHTSRKIILMNLHKVQSVKFLESFLCSLSLTCFYNEYIFKVTQEEVDELFKIEKEIKNNLNKKDYKFNIKILILSSYKRLVEYSWHSKFKKFKYSNIYKVQCLDFNEEKKIKSTIKEIGIIDNRVSMEMKKQYELYPYPRWSEVNLKAKHLTIGQVCDNMNLLINQNDTTQRSDIKILVAGCGTGKQSIELSLKFPKSSILAVDLSKSSLAYAIRKTKELNINNIDYLCMDILNIKSLKKSFDYISCGGVLHHMKNPIIGWKKLLGCLNKNGLLEIALYSKLARKDILRLRDRYRIYRGIFKSSDLIEIRNNIINENRNISRSSILYNEDFFSLSGFKDLLVNENEIHYNTCQIKNILNDLDLSFCGFQLTDFQLQILKNEKERPFSLDEWNIIENNYPHFFSTMYHFWCQKNN